MEPKILNVLKVFWIAMLDFGSPLILIGSIYVASLVIKDLKLEAVFKRVTALTKLVLSIFVGWLLFDRLNVVYGQLTALINPQSSSVPIIKMERTLGAVVFLVVLYRIYKSLQPRQEQEQSSEQSSESDDTTPPQR